jgi:LysR family glycine cleavage system transcriptional activator/LysR family transcriptional regulator of beta-lactamase
MRQMPSLNGLRAFEAAGRLGSFAAAADELNVTQTAISRMVRLLEQRLGYALFNRRANGLAISERGAALLPGVTAAVDDLARHCARVAVMAAPSVLTLAAGPSFSMRWLIPRLARFQAAHPTIEVRLATVAGLATGDAPFSDEWTAAIRIGNGHWPSLQATRLFDADLFPVCAPALADKLRRLQDLAKVPLLRVTSGAQDWPIWLKAVDLRGITPRGPRFDYDAFALQAALDGLGVALAHRPYVADDLAAGRLVAPFPHIAARGEGWYFVHRAGMADHAALRLFRTWLLNEAEKTRILGRDGAQARRKTRATAKTRQRAAAGA